MHMHGWAIADKDGRLLTIPAENLPFAQQFRVAICQSAEYANLVIARSGEPIPPEIDPTALMVPESFEGAHAVGCTVTVETYDPFVEPPKADDLRVLELRHRLEGVEGLCNWAQLVRQDTDRQLGAAKKREWKWAMAIEKVGIERFDKAIVAEVEAALAELKEFQDALIAFLKRGNKTIPPKDEPMVLWMRSHPNIKHRVIQGGEHDGYLEFWWEEKTK